jgi:DNA polymerase-3 subunit epsilon
MTIHSSDQLRARQQAQKYLENKPVFLDTETTGLDNKSEIVEVAIVDLDGSILLETLVKPLFPIPASITAIHGITNQQVQNQRLFPEVWREIQQILSERLVGIFNADFDLRMISQSLHHHRVPSIARIDIFCIMKLYAQYRGIYNPATRSYKWFSLENAGRDAHISLLNTHRAIADALLARALLFHIAGVDTSEM